MVCGVGCEDTIITLAIIGKPGRNDALHVTRIGGLPRRLVEAGISLGYLNRGHASADSKTLTPCSPPSPQRPW